VIQYRIDYLNDSASDRGRSKRTEGLKPSELRKLQRENGKTDAK